MAKMIPPQGLRSVKITTERGEKVYNAGKDGLIHVDNPKHARQMKHEGLGVASTAGAIQNFKAVGYTCKSCGFGSFFKKCGKCGELNE